MIGLALVVVLGLPLNREEEYNNINYSELLLTQDDVGSDFKLIEDISQGETDDFNQIKLSELHKKVYIRGGGTAYTIITNRIEVPINMTVEELMKKYEKFAAMGGAYSLERKYSLDSISEHNVVYKIRQELEPAVVRYYIILAIKHGEAMISVDIRDTNQYREDLIEKFGVAISARL